MGVELKSDEWVAEASGQAVAPGGAAVSSPSQATEPEVVPAPLPRDRILILGRYGAGKTIFLARLYEALWQGCAVPGRRRGGNDAPPAPPVELKARCLQGSGHWNLLKVIEDLRKGNWPNATQGLDYIEMEVSHAGRTHLITTLDFAGEIFSEAFFKETDRPDAVELRNAVDRAAAVLLLVDPGGVAKGGEDAQHDTFGMTQVVVRIRRAVGGANVPIAIVFTKCDQNKPLLREAGGAKGFSEKYLRQLMAELKKPAVFPSTAIRSSSSSRGKSIPDLSQPPVNVVESLLYCIRAIEIGGDLRVAEEARREMEEQVRQEELASAEHRERRRWLRLVTWIGGGVAALAIAYLLAATILFLVGTPIFPFAAAPEKPGVKSP